MKKIIILSYFYTPSNFVGAERIVAWAKNLNKNGIYPIIITRNWNENQKDIVDEVLDNKLKIEKTENYEVHRLPYRQSLRDKCSKYSSLKYFQKFLSLYELLMSNYFISAIPYNNIYHYARKLLKSNSEIEIVIASGRPFQLFSFGYQLKKEFKIFWIPDYRDEWTTHQNSEVSKGLINKFLGRLEQKSELKWTSNADFFISVSENWVESITKFINKKGFVVMNGFNKIESLTDKTNSKSFRIVYAGTIYSSQRIELFIDSCILFNQHNKTEVKLEVLFIGTELNISVHNYLLRLTKEYDTLFSFLPRQTKNKLNVELEKADLLLLTGFENVKGWYPVKLFEYYASLKPILLFPSDNDVMEHFLSVTKSGYIINNQNECQELFHKLVNQKINKEIIKLDIDFEKGDFYSRAYQTNLLGNFINTIEKKS